jgi:hypothetical protein
VAPAISEVLGIAAQPGRPLRETLSSMLLLLLVPFIPRLRDIPRIIPVHRIIWRDWYESHQPPPPDPAAADAPEQARS